MDGSEPDLQLRGADRELALAEFESQLREWGLRMPDVTPLVLHFGLREFRRFGLVEYWIANEIEVGYCGKFLFVFDGQTCPTHHHRVKHETFFVLKGSVRMVVAGAEHLLRQGDRLVIPPGTRHSFTGVGNALLLEVSLPSTLGDNLFEDKRIGENGVI